MRIAAILPVYREPRRLVEIVSRLLEDKAPASGVVIVVDGETTPSIGEALACVRSLPRVSVIEGMPHAGKAKALNRAVRSVEAELLLFLDNDIHIPEGRRLFSSALALFEEADIAEIPKVGRGQGLVAAMCRYEFLANLIPTEYVVRRTGRFPCMNGAAYAIRRALFLELGGYKGVVNEDTDLAARAFLAGARFGFDPDMAVENEVPETTGDWLRQRRRWVINAALWSTVYMGRILRGAPSMRKDFMVSGIFFPLPLASLLGGALLPLVPAALAGATPLLTAVACLAGGLAAFGATSLWFGKAAKRFGSPFDPLSFFLYATLYLPVWAAFSLAGMVSVSLGRIPRFEWKFDVEEVLATVALAKAEDRRFEAARREERRRRLSNRIRGYSIR